MIPTRVDTHRLAEVKRSLQMRGMLFAVAAVPTFGFALIWSLLSAVAIADAKDAMTQVAGVLVLFLGGVVPALIGAVIVWRAVVNLREHARLDRLVLAIASGAVRTLDDLGREMRTTTVAAETALSAAIGRGIFSAELLRGGQRAPASAPPGYVLPATVTDRALGLAALAPSAAPAGYPPVPMPSNAAPAGYPPVAMPSNAAPAGYPPVPMSYGASPASYGAPPFTPRSHAPPQLAISGVVRSEVRWLGRTIRGKYLVEAPLGQGGMGVVFRGRNLESGAPCAIKALLSGRYAAPDAVKRFEREAMLARALGHPGLVRIEDFGYAEDGTPFLVMELLEGETLEERLAREGSLRWSEVRRIAVAIGDALAAAHAAGFLHRDVKPSNIVLAVTPWGERPVLIDFGLAKRLDSTTRSRVTSSGVAIGTPLYMSPEQARGEALDHRSDLYGLAIVVYEMMAGVPPFFDKTLAEVYARLLKEAPPPLRHVAPGPCPPALEEALGKALATRREDRYGDVPSFLEALKRAA
ncbi:Serine/threonine protein kinase [Minicystis rosea]|nr:Serine/threonine protein kinase [Minicystis rosea]